MTNPHIGSTFESFLEEQGLKEEVDLLAQKRMIAWQIEQAMAEEEITKAEMAARMKTSRTQIDRLLRTTGCSSTRCSARRCPLVAH